MENKEVFWTSGVNDFIQKQLIIKNNERLFTYTINENDFEPNRKISDIFYDHLVNRGTKTVEVLYSGGADSELVLASCIKNKIPCEAVTMAIRIKGALVNVYDLYFSEKFCRENNIRQRKYFLNVDDFFYNGKYEHYLTKYDIVYSHVATHFWLIEQCNSFPIIGGDWPWVQAFNQPKVLSPQKLDYNYYDKFMIDKGISGIGSMISHSFESCYRFMQLQLEHANSNEQNAYTSSFLKQKMYSLTEPRIRSYGWEDCPRAIFDINLFNNKLMSKYKAVDNTIVWGEKVKKLLNTNINQNNKH